MKISTIQPLYVPALRSLAESASTVGATAEPSGPVDVAGQRFALHARLPALPGALPGQPAPGTASDQFETLKLIAREFVLPSIKAAWPDASNVVTGVQVIWAGAEFWDTVRDADKDGHQKTIAGVRLANSVVGLGLSIQQAPSDALLVNTISGFVVATADKLYTVKLEREDAAKQA